MNIFKKIIKYFKDFFLSFYKSTEIVPTEKLNVSNEPLSETPNIDSSTIVTVNNNDSYKINIFGYIKDYTIIDIKVKIDDEDSISLDESLGYKEEYILESDYPLESLYLSFSCSIKCIDGEVLSNLCFTKLISKGITNIYVTDKLLGLKAITFGAVTEDFTPEKIMTVKI